MPNSSPSIPSVRVLLVGFALSFAVDESCGAEPALSDGDWSKGGLPTTFELIGGGTVFVDTEDDCTTLESCPVFPGTLENSAADVDVFDFTISASPFFGHDGLLHPTRLLVDTDGDSVPDLQIAEDTDGDGAWDSIEPGYDTDTDGSGTDHPDGNPDVSLDPGEILSYSLHRPVSPLQLAYRDPVTLTATSQTTDEFGAVTAVNLLPIVTRATIGEFGAARVGADVVVSWTTTSEHRTAGFVVEGRSANGSVRKLHQGLVGAAPEAPRGARYRLVDRMALPGDESTYVLFEVDLEGNRRLVASHRSTIDAESAEPSPPRGFERRVRMEPQRALPGRPSLSGVRSKRNKRGGDEARLRINVGETGLYFVEATAVAAELGLPASMVSDWIADGFLRIHRGIGTETEADDCPTIPIPVDGIFLDGFESGDFCAWSRSTATPTGRAVAVLAADDASGLYFFGEQIDSIYTNDNVYWLEVAPAHQMPATPAGTPTAVDDQDFTDNRHFEETGPHPVTSVVTDPDSDFWFWDFVNVTPDLGLNFDTMTVDIDASGRNSAALQAILTVFLQAETSDDSIDPDHLAEIRLNGNLIGSSSWDGSSAHQIDLALSPSLLVDGANTVEIHAPATTGIDSEIYYLDSVRLVYPRFYRAVDDLLIAGSDGHSTLTIDGFTSPEITVIDISDGDFTEVIADPVIEPGDGGFRVSFDPEPGATRYLATLLSQAMNPTLELDLESNLRAKSNRADYLVIAAPGLEMAADQLATYRQSEGFETQMIRLQDIYDEFGRGIVSPWAIRDFLIFTMNSWQLAPSYVVLAGDSSFDYEDNLGFGGDLLPSPMVSTPEGLFPSDHRIADLTGNDGVPEVALGRIPARTNAELADYVDKLISRETTTEGMPVSVWVADAADEGGEFADGSEQLISLVPPGLDVERVFVDQLGSAPARQAVLDSLGAGATFLHFLGHGNLSQMGDDAGLLLTGDVAGLGMTSTPAVVSAMTCAVGRFDRVFFDTLSETLVLRPDGGAVALWAPTGFPFNQEGVGLATDLVTRTLGGGSGSGSQRLGSAIRDVLATYAASADESREFLPFVLTLLGDPAIRIWQ